METQTPSRTRRSLWFSDELWDTIKRTARKLSAEYDREISASDFIRQACRYALEHPEILKPDTEGEG